MEIVDFIAYYDSIRLHSSLEYPATWNMRKTYCEMLA